jgi:ParB-like chromosome segregation protein Spo0J
MNDITKNQDDDDGEFDPNIPTFEMAKQQRSELIAELRQGEAGEQRLADLLAQCHKGSRCNLHECPVCQRRKELPKYRIPASISKSWLGRPHEIRLSSIRVVGERRPLNEAKLRTMMASMDRIGLQTPITVRMQKKEVMLVAGGYRFAAAKRLGWTAIPCVEFCSDEIDARMWQIEENVCRADLAVLERAEHIEEFRTLIQNRSEGGQVAPPGGHQPKNSGIKKTAKALGITREEVRRSRVIAGLSEKAKAEVRKLGLDDKQAALLAIAKEPAAPAQLRMVKEIAERKRADLVHRVSAAPAAVDKKMADEINALEADIQTKMGVVERVNGAVAAHRKRLHEMHDKLAVEDVLAAGSEAAEQEARQLAGGAGDVESMVPEQDADQSARRSDDQGTFGRLQRRWEKFLSLDWKDASPKTRARFVAEVLGYPDR